MTTEIVIREIGDYGQYTIEFHWVDISKVVCCRIEIDPSQTSITELFELAKEARERADKT